MDCALVCLLWEPASMMLMMRRSFFLLLAQSLYRLCFFQDIAGLPPSCRMAATAKGVRALQCLARRSLATSG